MLPPSYAGVENADYYDTLHPQGLTSKGVAEYLIDRDIDLFFCSFNPQATRTTESELSKEFLNHPKNCAAREIVAIPLVDPKRQSAAASLAGGCRKHIVFVLDESGSMSRNWSGVVYAYNQFLHKRRMNQSLSDIVSVVQFDSSARTTVQMKQLTQVPSSLDYHGGGTCFSPAANSAKNLVDATPSTHVPVLVFMSDGEAHDYDAFQAASTFASINSSVQSRFGDPIELHVIAFGSGANTTQLRQIAQASPHGKIYTSGDVSELAEIFVSIAGGQDVGQVLQGEVAKRISEAVADRLAIGYLA